MGEWCFDVRFEFGKFGKWMHRSRLWPSDIRFMI